MRLHRIVIPALLVMAAVAWRAPAAGAQDATTAAPSEATLVEDATTAAPSDETPAEDATTAAPSDEAMAEAVAAYRDHDFAVAAQIFAALARVEPDAARRAVLHANAGTAAARAEQLGDAVWHLRAAQRLAPRDVITRANLQRVAAMVGTGTTEASQFTDALLAAPRHLSADETHQLTGILAGLGLLFGGLWRWSRLRVFGWLTLLLLTLSATWWVWSTLAARAAEREAVVIESVVPLRSEPQGDGLILLRVGAGALVSSEEVRGDWRLVETAEGGRGWAPAEDVRLLP